MEKPQTSDESRQVQLELGRVFTPSAPIDRAAMFSGRRAERNAAVDAVNQRGQHAVIYGERGVGKTSLANVISDYLESFQENLRIICPRVNCTADDDFSSIWNMVFQQVMENKHKRKIGFVQEIVESVEPLASKLPKRVRPDDVRLLLEVMGEQAITIVVIDEFDRCKRNGVSTALADTIKMLSDRAVRATIILVGVADHVEELIAEHRSVERALRQIHMPRMTPDGAREILEKGYNSVSMTAHSEAVDGIVRLSQGLPTYAHLLGRECGRIAARDLRRDVGIEDLERGVRESLTHVSETTKTAYHKAIRSPRKDNLFRQVLLACALAEGDSLGYFAAGDVRAPLREITKTSYEIPTFAKHLKEFCSEKRGPVLERTGVPHNYFYRFINPLMQPYVIMEGIADSILDRTRMSHLRFPSTKREVKD